MNRQARRQELFGRKGEGLREQAPHLGTPGFQGRLPYAGRFLVVEEI